MRLAILGTRGIPAHYGGFETFAEELGSRLAARGHEVTVYCRYQGHRPKQTSYRGVRLRYLPSIHTKHAETLSHTLLSAVDAAARDFDVVYVCNSANAPFCFVPYVFRKKTILNVDGLEWLRAKWGPLPRFYYRLAASLAAKMPIEIVTDARVIQDFYRDTMGRATHFFPYGTALYDRGSFAERLSALGLSPDRYVLYVSRLEPENNAHLVLSAYRQVETDVPLVIVGDAPYASDYIDRLRGLADKRVQFLGYRFGDDYHALQANALVYVQATEVGGTHPALVEALGHRNAVVAHDVPEHREVVGEAGVYFRFRDEGDLGRRLSSLLSSDAKVHELRERAGRRAIHHYSWDRITERYETYFLQLLAS